MKKIFSVLLCKLLKVSTPWKHFIYCSCLVLAAAVLFAQDTSTMTVQMTKDEKPAQTKSMKQPDSNSQKVQGLLLTPKNNLQNEISTITVFSPRLLTDAPCFSLPRLVEQSTIVYEGNPQNVILQKGLSQTKIDLGPGKVPTLDPKRKRLAYLAFEILPDGKRISNTLIILDLETNKVSSFTVEGQDLMDSLKWSFSGNYLAVRVASPGKTYKRSWLVLQSESLKIVAKAPQCRDIGWIGENAIVTLPFSRFEKKNGHSQDKYNAGIGFIILKTGRQRKIKTSSWKYDFDIVAGGRDTVILGQDRIRNWDDWYKPGSTRRTFLKVTADGKARKISNFQNQALDDFNSIEKELHYKEAGYMMTDFSSHPKASNWKLFLIRTSNIGLKHLEYFICIADLNDPSSSIRIIGDGMAPRW